MRRVFCIFIMVLLCATVRCEVVTDAWGNTLFYGKVEKFTEVERYMWFSGQDKLDVNPENSSIYGIGVGISEHNGGTTELEAMRKAELDFKCKMKMIYYEFLSEEPNEEFFDQMLSRCRRGSTTWRKVKKNGEIIVVTYYVVAITKNTLDKYYPEVPKELDIFS